MKHLPRVIVVVLIAALTICLVAPVTSTVEAKTTNPKQPKAPKKPAIVAFYIKNYGVNLGLQVRNRTKKTVVISRKARFYGSTYRYFGTGSPNKPGSGSGYFTKKQMRMIVYKPRKAVKIKPGETKWVNYKKVTKGYFKYINKSDMMIFAGYKQGGKKKTCSKAFVLNFNY